MNSSKNSSRYQLSTPDDFLRDKEERFFGILLFEPLGAVLQWSGFIVFRRHELAYSLSIQSMKF
jgi:hypothetical protein